MRRQMMAMCSGAEIASQYVFQRAPNARYSCRQKQVEIAAMLKRDAVVDVSFQNSRKSTREVEIADHRLSRGSSSTDKGHPIKKTSFENIPRKL
jgi:hypothetical protein